MHRAILLLLITTAPTGGSAQSTRAPSRTTAASSLELPLGDSTAPLRLTIAGPEAWILDPADGVTLTPRGAGRGELLVSPRYEAWEDGSAPSCTELLGSPPDGNVPVLRHPVLPAGARWYPVTVVAGTMAMTCLHLPRGRLYFEIRAPDAAAIRRARPVLAAFERALDARYGPWTGPAFDDALIRRLRAAPR